MSGRFTKIKYLLIAMLLSMCCINTSHADILFQDKFNDYTGNPNGHGWNADNLWNTAQVVAGAGPDASNALRITFDTDRLGRWCNWVPTQNIQEFYIKFNFKMDCGSGTCAGGAKFLKVFGQQNGTAYANTTTAFDYGYPSPIFTGLSYGASGDSRDTSSVLWYSGAKSIESGGVSPLITAHGTGNIDPKDGKWHTWELHMKYNDDGQNNGVYEAWYDGTQVLGASGVNNRSTLDPKFVGKIQLGGWNQNYGGIPYNIYFDNVIISTTRDSAISTTLSAPLNLRVTLK